MENPLHGAKESPNGTSPSEITPLLTFPEKEDSIEKENSALGRSFLIQIFHSIFTSQKSENQKPLNRDPSSLTPLSSRAKSRDPSIPVAGGRDDDVNVGVSTLKENDRTTYRTRRIITWTKTKSSSA